MLVHDNAQSYSAKLVKETIKAFGRKILSHPAYSPGLTSSDYCLSASLGTALTEHFTSYENGSKTRLPQKRRAFLGRKVSNVYS